MRTVSSGGSATNTPMWQGAVPPSEQIKIPVEHFRSFFDNALISNIVEQSNLFSIQQNPNKPLALKISVLEQFIGTVIYMSIFGLPRSRMFWATESRIAQVADILSRDRWEEIKKIYT